MVKVTKVRRSKAVEEALSFNPDAVYYQGNPCKYGHSGLRYVKDGHCRYCIEEKLAKKQVLRAKGFRIFN